jgi:hypothetical protein
MKLKTSLTIILTISTSLLFSACKGKIEPEPKIIYVKAKVPKQRYLRRIPKYTITDVVETKDRYCIKKNQLRRASDTSLLIRKQNYFYRKQVVTFNKKFVPKKK